MYVENHIAVIGSVKKFITHNVFRFNMFLVFSYFHMINIRHVSSIIHILILENIFVCKTNRSFTVSSSYRLLTFFAFPISPCSTIPALFAAALHNAFVAKRSIQLEAAMSNPALSN